MTTPPAPTALRPYQVTALERLASLYNETHTRATLTLPCGLGKTVVAAHVITADTALTVMFVPTVALLTQTIDRLRVIIPTARYLAVCSPASATTSTDDTADDVPAGADPAPLPHTVTATTDPDDVADAISGVGQLVIVSTYASAAVISAALDATSATVDLLICDEAHRTAGFATKSWAQPLNDTTTPARRRLFMTATAKVVTLGDEPPESTDTAPVQVLSMESIADYGVHVSPISFRQGINDGWLSDYRIAVVAVGNSAVADMVRTYRPTPGSPEMNLTHAATQLALLRYLRTHHVTSMLVFHNSISDSQHWTVQMRDLAEHTGLDLEVLHVDGTSPPDIRDYALTSLANPDKVTIVSNCRVFSEGVDIPGIDAVLFAAPRTSSPDIVQIVGRAIRPHPAGRDRKALIIVPVIETDTDTTPIDIKASRTGFYTAWQVLTTLAEEDDYINNALTQWRATTGDPTAPPPDPTDEPIIDIDTELIDAFTDADVFRFHVVHRTTSHHVLTAAKLRAYYAHTGRTNPSPSYRAPDGYPLGAKIQATRRAHRADLLPPRVARLFDAIPGWQWTTATAAPRRTADDWINLIDHHVTTTRIHTIHRWERTTDPATGSPAAIGEWLHKPRRLASLTDTQRARLTALVTLS